MATWTLTAQGSDGGVTNVAVDPSDRIWFNSTTDKNGNVTVGQYQDFTHIYTAGDTAHRCSSTHINNTKYSSSSQVSINGAGAVTFSPTVPNINQVPFKFTLTPSGGDPSNIVTSGAKLYAYQSGSEAVGPTGVDFRAFEKIGTSNTPSWVEAEGSGTPLHLGDQGSAASHNYYIGVSASPTSTGAKTGGIIKIVVTYI